MAKKACGDNIVVLVQNDLHKHAEIVSGDATKCRTAFNNKLNV